MKIPPAVVTYLQVLPLFLVLLVFLGVPLVLVVVVSFYDYDMFDIVPEFTLRNYAGRCDFERPAWLDEALADRQESLRRYRNARVIERYLDRKPRYIHLVDGGVADNLGLRGPLDNVILVGGLRERFDQLAVQPRYIVIIVVNADKLRVTGNKAEQKVYYRHSGFPGGIYGTKFKDMQAKHPGRALEKAVKGMLPKGPLGYAMIKKLKVYAGAEHPHTAQQPKTLDI